MSTLKNIFFLFCAILPSTLLAQTAKDTIKTSQLQEIVVTGTKTERRVATLPLPAQIITGESIRKTGLSKLSEIIQEQTGLITIPDFGGGEGIQIQGLDAEYVMILIDGQPLLGRSAGTLDLSRISINNVERIEIIKGASSCLYGSEALAGVVNIITKKPEINQKLEGNLHYKIGSFNTHDIASSLAYGKKKIGLELFGNYFQSNGYNLTENTFSQTVEPYKNTTIQPKLKINFSDKLHLSLNTRWYVHNQDRKALINHIAHTGESNINEWNNALTLQQSIASNAKITYELYSSRYHTEEYLQNTQKIRLDESFYRQNFYKAEIRSNYTVGKNIITAGIGTNYEVLNRTYFADKASLNAAYLFGQAESFIKEKWNILAGFRYDHHYQYQSQLSPKVGINYKWNEYFSLKTSIGYGYKAPDLRQLFFNFTNSAIGYTVLGYNVAAEKLAELTQQGEILFSNKIDFSQPLKPESSLNLNWGGYYKKQKLHFDYNIFYNSIRNLIDARAIAQKNNGQNIFSYFNIDRIITYGLELNTSYQPHTHLTISAGYQYLQAKDRNIIQQIKEGKIFARNPITHSSFLLQPNEYFGLYNRSKHTANVKIQYQIPSINTDIHTRVFYRSPYGIFDSNNNQILDTYDDFVKGYFLINLALNKNFKYGITTQIGIINILNYKDEKNISNLAGRQFFAKIQYQF